MTLLKTKQIISQGLFLICLLLLSPSAYSQTPSAFCDNFDDENVWQSRWQNICGSQVAVNSPTHSGTGALMFVGPVGVCYPQIRLNEFEAEYGEFSVWHYQTNSNGGRLYTQVIPSGDPTDLNRQSYCLGFGARDGMGGGTFQLTRIDGVGNVTTLFTQASPQFVMNQWVRFFIRNEGQGRLRIGYEHDAIYWETLIVDPTPLTGAGEVHLLSCSDPSNYYDDFCYQALPVIPQADHDAATFGNGHCFNGTDHYIGVPHNSSLNLANNYTIESWIYLDELPSSTTPEFAIVSKWLGTGSPGFMFGVAGPGNLGKLILNAGYGVDVYSLTVLVPHKWYHVAVTVNNQAIQFFVDGVADPMITRSGGSSDNTSVLAIGRNTHAAANRYYFKGKIDEVRISNKVRSANEFCLDAPCSPGLNTAALWHLDESGAAAIVDESGNGNTGTVQGNQCAPPQANYEGNPDFGASHCFNGSDDYISVPNNSSLDVSGQLTIEAWVKLDQLPSGNVHQTIVTKWIDPNINPGAGSGGWALVVNGSEGTGAGKLLLHVPGGYAFSNRVLTAGVWQHVAVTVGSGMASFFIDGLPAGGGAVGNGLNNTSSPLTIGMMSHHLYNANVLPYYFKGKIDEVRISSVVRAPSDFALIAPSVPLPSTMGLWHMGGFSGLPIADYSDNSNNGTSHGAGCEFVTCPTPPVLSAIPYCDHILLQWTDAGDEEGYELYRNDNRIEVLGANVTSYQDHTVIAGSFTYKIRALRINCPAAESDPEVFALNRIPDVPEPPSVRVDDSWNLVCWEEVEGVDAYCLYRNGTLIECYDLTTFSCREDVNPFAQSCYQISARNECGESDLSQSNCVDASISVCGQVFEDRDGDLLMDEGEARNGALIELQDVLSGEFNGEGTTIGPDGRYCFAIQKDHLYFLVVSRNGMIFTREPLRLQQSNYQYDVLTREELVERFNVCASQLEPAVGCAAQGVFTFLPDLGIGDAAMVVNGFYEAQSRLEAGNWCGALTSLFFGITDAIGVLEQWIVYIIALAEPTPFGELGALANDEAVSRLSLLAECVDGLILNPLFEDIPECFFGHHFAGTECPVTLSVEDESGNVAALDSTGHTISSLSFEARLQRRANNRMLAAISTAAPSFNLVVTADDSATESSTFNLTLLQSNLTPHATLLRYEGIPIGATGIARLNNINMVLRNYVLQVDIDSDGTSDLRYLPTKISDSACIKIAIGTGMSNAVIGAQLHVFDALDNLVAEIASDGLGCAVSPKLMAGEYKVALDLPLGYTCNEPIKTVKLSNDSATVNFELSKLIITPQQRSRDYWAGQLTKVLQNKPASYTRAQFSRFAGLISQHFNDNLLNSVATYVVPQPANQTDSLVIMKKLLTFGCTEVNEPFLKKVAKGELVALMLNVAAGKVSQTHVVTHEGATLSQAITYCDMLVNEADCPIGIVPAWFMPGYPNRLEVMRYLKASFVAGLINVGVTLPSGTIPSDIMNIAYKESANPPLPSDFELSQNHPNPFNPITTIRFAVPQAGSVQLEVLNIIGQKVCTLVDEVRPAGTHEVQWDGRDNNGVAVSSGVYLYRIKAGEFTETKKMVLMK